jgi:DNA-binding NtrC family response regulator
VPAGARVAPSPAGRDAGDASVAVAPGAPVVSYTDALAAWERQFLIDALAACDGKVVEAAARIGIGRATLYKKLAALGIDRWHAAADARGHEERHR